MLVIEDYPQLQPAKRRPARLNMQQEKGAMVRRRLHASEQSRTRAATDARLLKAIAENQDARALSDLFDIYGPKLKGWLMARSVGSATAEDIVQDVMIKVWVGAAKFDPEKASFATWIYRITRNRWIDHKRKHSRMEVCDPDVMSIISDDEVPSAEAEFVKQESAVLIRENIDRLKPNQKQVITMAFLEHKTQREIAEETGMPLGTVKTRVRTALQILKSNLSGSMEDLL